MPELFPKMFPCWHRATAARETSQPEPSHQQFVIIVIIIAVVVLIASLMLVIRRRIARQGCQGCRSVFMILEY